jgi:sugar phosphate isomerase/epimerase
MLSITTDYVKDTGDPEPYLRPIAEAGFSHLHWCHHWNTDFLYSQPEIDQIALWLDELGLSILDIHASHGREKAWGSPREYERLAGLELVQNRMAMGSRLGSDVIILHLPAVPPDCVDVDAALGPTYRSLDALIPYAGEHGVRIALENMGRDNFDVLERLFSQYDSSFLGLCYDAGHGNVAGCGLDRLEAVKDRLISVHLHDNDGTGDQHKLLFTGTVDWARLARIIATSSYDKCVSMEVSMGNSGIADETVFLQQAFETGMRFAQMIADARQSALKALPSGPSRGL